MKLTAVVILTVACAVLAGCSKTQLPRVTPDEVAVYMPDDDVPKGYRVLKSIKTQMDVETADSVMVALARAEAASVGADALVIRELREYQEGRMDMRSGYPVRLKRLLGDAVYYPDRHQ
jgi:hypothetical protein